VLSGVEANPKQAVL